jgi:hypothetical protein
MNISYNWLKDLVEAELQEFYARNTNLSHRQKRSNSFK